VPPKEKGQQDLEPNHTHFLLLDDGTYSGYEIGDYRTRLVKNLSSGKVERGKDNRDKRDSGKDDSGTLMSSLIVMLVDMCRCFVQCPWSLSLSKEALTHC
jgi:hypothetical protein